MYVCAYGCSYHIIENVEEESLKPTSKFAQRIVLGDRILLRGKTRTAARCATGIIVIRKEGDGIQIVLEIL